MANRSIRLILLNRKKCFGAAKPLCLDVSYWIAIELVSVKGLLILLFVFVSRGVC